MERASERRMLTATHRKSLCMGMDDDLAQRLPRGGRRLDCGAVLTETPQLTEGRSWSGRSFFLKFVRVHKEDADDSCIASWRFIRINAGINTYYFGN